jgi:hypothetical protein
MPPQTLTHAVETESEPENLFKFLSEIENVPKWAPVFADRIERISDSRYRVIKNDEAFELGVFRNRAAGTVDYIREMSGGRRGGAYIRITPRPLGGSSVSMTVPIAANTSAADVAKVLEQELLDLICLAQS